MTVSRQLRGPSLVLNSSHPLPSTSSGTCAAGPPHPSLLGAVAISMSPQSAPSPCPWAPLGLHTAFSSVPCALAVRAARGIQGLLGHSWSRVPAQPQRGMGMESGSTGKGSVPPLQRALAPELAPAGTTLQRGSAGSQLCPAPEHPSRVRLPTATSGDLRGCTAASAPALTRSHAPTAGAAPQPWQEPAQRKVPKAGGAVLTPANTLLQK